MAGSLQQKQSAHVFEDVQSYFREGNNRYQSFPLPLSSRAQIQKGTTPAGRLCHNFPPREYFDLPLEQLVLSSVKADTERAGR